MGLGLGGPNHSSTHQYERRAAAASHLVSLQWQRQQRSKRRRISRTTSQEGRPSNTAAESMATRVYGHQIEMNIAGSSTSLVTVIVRHRYCSTVEGMQRGRGSKGAGVRGESGWSQGEGGRINFAPRWGMRRRGRGPWERVQIQFSNY